MSDEMPDIVKILSNLLLDYIDKQSIELLLIKGRGSIFIRIKESILYAYESGIEQGRSAKIIWPSLEEIRDVAKHEDSDGYFGFLTGCEWLRAKIDELNKGNGE